MPELVYNVPGARPRKLHKELSVVPEFDGLHMEDDEVRAQFTADPNVTQVDAIIAAHDGTPIYYRIYDHTNVPQAYRNNAPNALNFKTGLNDRLHPQRTFVNGVLTKTVYHENATKELDGSVTYTSPVVEEEFTYVRDADNLAVSRTQTIRWYLTDDTLGEYTKTREKVYEGVDSIRESQRRRGNVVDFLKTDMIGMIAITESLSVQDAIAQGRALFIKYGSEINFFIETGNGTLVQSITDDTEFTWLDNVIAAPSTTIRDHTIAAISA